MREEITFSMGLRGGVQRAAHPLYSDLSVEYSRETGEMAFGQTLSGKLKFIDTDYDWIMEQDRGDDIVVNVARDGIVFLGKFVITDCEIDYDGRKIEVELEADDAYSWLKSHWDDEYNLVELAPPRDIVEYRHRGCWQYYRQGDTKLTAIVGGDYFEMDATQTASYADLVSTGKYCFEIIDAEVSVYFDPRVNTDRHPEAAVVQGSYGIYKGLASGYLLCAERPKYRLKLTLGGDYGLGDFIVQYKNDSGGWTTYDISGLTRTDNGKTITYGDYVGVGQVFDFRYTGAVGTTALYFTGIFCRLVHNSESVSPKYNLPSDDIVERTLNYRYVSIPSADLVKVYATNEYSSEPTEWGLAPDNTNYYQKPKFPAVSGITYPLYPIGKTTWGEYSWWAGFDFTSGIFDYKWWAMAQLKDAYPLDSVLSVLLDAIFKDSGLKVAFGADKSYSEFLYGGYAGDVETPPNLFITPKSNILTSNYSQAAQKGNITIGQVLEMLRDVFRCMWFFERDAETGEFKLRLEHIFWFYNGADYDSGKPFDLTTAIDPRTGKYWDFASQKFSFDMAELYRRYEFGWQDECTDWFDGDNLSCLAKYVNKDAVNKIQVKAFTTDLDMMLLSPEEFNKDGFALLGAAQESIMDSSYIPTMTLSGGVESEHFALAQVLAAPMYVELVRNPQLVVKLNCYNAAGTLLSSSYSDYDDGRRRYLVPANTASIAYVLSSPTGYTAKLSIMPKSYYPRVELPKSSEDVAPQNYRLAFHYIERSWYLFDLPCRNIAYGDGQNREEYIVSPYNPIKKAMEQTIKMPYAGEMNLNAGMLSTLGASVVQSFTLNLLSLFAEMKLRYGTDAK